METLGHIRACKPEECHSLVRILRETNLLSSADTEEAFRKKLYHDRESIQIFYCGGEVVGMVIFVYDPWASFIWHLAIRPVCQGHGFGRRLIKKAEEIVARRGGRLTCAYILEGNKNSRRTFQKSGYREYPMPIIPVEKNL